MQVKHRDDRIHLLLNRSGDCLKKMDPEQGKETKILRFEGNQLAMSGAEVGRPH